MKYLLLGLSLFSAQVHAVQLQAVKVSGENAAEIQFVADGGLPATPRLVVDDNRVELFFNQVTLSPSLNTEITNPHVLIQRIGLANQDGGTQVRLLVNGSTSKLRDRVKLQKKEGGAVALVLNFPAGADATFKLLQEEQASITAPNKAATEARGGFGWGRLFVLLFLFGATGFGGWFLLKFAKKKSGWRGTRRHLIETLAQAPLSDKASVAILRVGGEFLLVGVSPGQVSLLSSLPRLQQEFDEENSLERDSFKEAVAQQAQRTRSLGLEA